MPISVRSQCDPASISAPQKVKVTITVTSIVDGDVSVPVTLYDPAGNVLNFTSGNANPLGMNQQATYTGEWNVTEAELNDGKIRYRVTFDSFDESTVPPTRMPTTQVHSVTIEKSTSSSSSSTKSATRPQAEWTVSPSSASKGQIVTLTYTVNNVASTDITNVQITNPIHADDKINVSRIGAGDKVTKTYQYTMGSKTVKAKPKVTYRLDGSDEVLTLANMSTKTIELEKGGVTVNLKTTGDAEVLPGEKVELVCTINNTSNTAYTDVKITDPILGDIATGIELKAKNGTHTEKKTVTVGETAAYAFQVTGMGSNDRELDMTSNPVQVVALDLTKQLQLSITAEAQVPEITQQPADVEFAIAVHNIGQSEGKDLTLKHGNITIAKIPLIEPGEEITYIKNLRVSGDGSTYMFTVSGVNEQGGTQNIDSNEVILPFVVPTAPPPPPTPSPTAPPPAETPEPVALGATDEGGSGIGMTILWVLGGVLVLAIAGVLGMIFIGRRRQAAEDAVDELVVDSIERGTRRDYQHRQPPAHGDTQRMRAQQNDAFEPNEELPYPTYGQEGVSYEADAGLTGDASMHDLAVRYGRPDSAPAAAEVRESAHLAPSERRSAEDATNAYLARMRETGGANDGLLANDMSDAGAYRRRRARSANAT